MPRKKKPANPAPEHCADDVCFVIMPFGGFFDDYYSLVYKPAIEAADLVPKRADDLYRPSTIINDIWTYTKKAKIILADLSGKNPNVFYELGLAHALTKPAILVTESIDDVPFDLRALRVIEYRKNSPFWGQELQKAITTAIREVIASPLDSVLPAFLKIKESEKPKPVSESEKAILELRRDVDLLTRNMRNGPRAADLISSVGEAEEAARSWRRNGMPKGLIVRRLIDRGVPNRIADKIVEDLGELRQHELPIVDEKRANK